MDSMTPVGNCTQFNEEMRRLAHGSKEWREIAHEIKALFNPDNPLDFVVLNELKPNSHTVDFHKLIPKFIEGHYRAMGFKESSGHPLLLVAPKSNLDSPQPTATVDMKMVFEELEQRETQKTGTLCLYHRHDR